jgi:hypothetical protein
MSYISSLNLLGDDSPVPISEEALSEELALWANAQFTFDTKPGSAILDDSYKAIAEQQDLFSTFTSLNEFNHNHNDKSNENHLMNSYLNNTSYLLPTKAIQPTIQPQPQPQPTTATATTTNNLPRIAPAPPQPLSETKVTISPVQSKTASKKRRLSVAVKETTDNEEEVTEAMEEDKRRRNTAASARFRMKKKLREQALEKTAKEMTLKAEALEKRVIELEKEAKWLRALVVEKDPALLNVSN